ncbi:MAG: metallopeptidase, partial [Actinomycetia bacterium]|nr:metallopeptidase [Actinomycetes bacterium]
MSRYRDPVAGATSFVLVLGVATAASPARAATGAAATSCTAGAHTLSPPGSRLYPDTGNGGYTSLHTDVHLVYDATANRFLPGNHVTVTDQATRCLSSFSLDFERRSVNKTAGPDMTVTSVRVNGRPASFTFVQPTYPGDPHGPNDPNPLAH